jgi:hypothetical protein
LGWKKEKRLAEESVRRWEGKWVTSLAWRLGGDLVPELGAESVERSGILTGISMVSWKRKACMLEELLELWLVVKLAIGSVSLLVISC